MPSDLFERPVRGETLARWAAGDRADPPTVHIIDTGRSPTLGPVRWLVDGMNVIGTRPDGWWKDRDAAMLRLVDLLERWAATEGEDVTVVFERPPRPPIRSTVIEVAHAPKPRPDSADDEIIRRLGTQANPHLVRVVTSDRWLADRAFAAGATVEGAESFRGRIEA